MRYDICAPLKRTAVYGGSKGVVDDQRNAVSMRDLCEKLDVKNRERGVCDSLAEHRLGVLSERRVKFLLGRVGGNEGEINSHSLESYREKVERSAVDSRAGDHVIAAGCDVKDCEEVRRLTGRGQHSGSTAFHIADLSRDAVVGGVLKTCVEISRSLEVKELTHLGARFILKGRALNYRYLSGLTVSGCVSALHAFGLYLVV